MMYYKNECVEYWFDENFISYEDFAKLADDQSYKIDGYLHREDGPCKTLSSTYSGPLLPFYFEWRIHGKYHREDGPAVYGYGNNQIDSFYLFGQRYTFSEWLERTPYFTSDEERIAYKLSYGISDEIC